MINELIPTVRAANSRSDSRIVRRLVRGTMALLIAITAALFTTSPARAATGGGCTGGFPVSACISFRSTDYSVVADFYFNATPDISWYSAYMRVVTTNNGTCQSPLRRLNAGHSNVITCNVNNTSNRSGSAVNTVYVFDSTGAPHGQYPSHRVYYP